VGPLLNPDLDYGWAEFDVRHRFVGSAIWELPLAKNSTGFAKALLNGWQLSLLFNAQSGAPFSIGDCTNGVDFYCARMAVVAGLNAYNVKAQPDVANTWDYLDISNQAEGVGTIASALTGDNEVWADADTSKMSKRDAFRGPAPGTSAPASTSASASRTGSRCSCASRLTACSTMQTCT
jgi:hypothetical protein